MKRPAEHILNQVINLCIIISETACQYVPPADTLAVHADITYVVVVLAEKENAMKHTK